VSIGPGGAPTFILIHGAWHGAWCWERLISSLTNRGLSSIAVNLPIEDDTATFHDYAGVVCRAIPLHSHELVLVGHSLGGMTLPLIAARHPVRSIVFLCGVVPRPGGQPWDDGPPMTAPGVFDGLVTHEDGSTSVPFDTAKRAFYSDCSEEDAIWACERLRPQHSGSLWEGAYPDIDSRAVRQLSIVGTRDPVVTLPWSRHVAATRLGRPAIELPVGHSPFLAEPDVLAETLVSAAL
jgi:pimeloyl-ACP methyl ester carboxylesterase